MKESLLKRLRCTLCGASRWEVRGSHASDVEILEGALLCQACGCEYPVRHGIVDAVHREKAFQGADETQGWIQLADKEGWNAVRADYLDAIPFNLAKALMPGDSMTWDRHGRNFFRALSHLDLPGKQVLDLGAGRCWSTHYLALQGADCVATDLVSAENVGLRAAAHYMRDQPIYFERVRCDMNEIPFNDGSFDFVFAQAAIHHSQDLPNTFREAARVLRPGGELVLTNEDSCHYKGVESFEVKHLPGIHEHCYRGYRQYLWLRRAGFHRFRLVPDVYTFRRDAYGYHPLEQLGRLHPFFLKLKLLIFGGVFNLIARKG